MNLRRYETIVAVYPNARGAAYVVFEGPFAPLDWGVCEPRGAGKNKQSIARIARILGRYGPEALLLPDFSDGGDRHTSRVKLLIDALATLAETQGICVVSYSKAAISKAFALEGLATKQRIVEAIAKHIPMFKHLVPPVRKVWQTEHARMGLFDATALVLTFYRVNKQTS